LLLLAQLARSTFYYQLKVLGADDADAELKATMGNIYKLHKGNYGYRRVTDALRQDFGYIVNNKKVFRLLGELGMRSTQRPKKYRSYKGEVGTAAENILDRKFDADEPNEKWTTDVTEFKCDGKKLYLSPVLDMYNGEIIAYEMHTRPKFDLVGKMIQKAFATLGPQDRPLLHSDQGWHYRMKEYRAALEQRGLVQSMSRKGNCHDNAVMENFFGILKSEMFYQQKFNCIDKLRNAISAYIEYYNNDRIKSRLKGLSPVKYRAQKAKILATTTVQL
jgi:transposase InsO family protein